MPQSEADSCFGGIKLGAAMWLKSLGFNLGCADLDGVICALLCMFFAWRKNYEILIFEVVFNSDADVLLI